MIPRIALTLSSLLLVLAGASVASAQASSALGAPTLDAPEYQPPVYEAPSTGYPAQRSGWSDLPSPEPYERLDTDRALSPNGPRVIALREEIQNWREEAASIDVDTAMGFWIGGVVTAGVGAITSLVGLTALDGATFGGGLIAAGTGLVTFLASFIAWRVQARRRHNREQRANELEQQLRVLTGRAPMPTPFRF